MKRKCMEWLMDAILAFAIAASVFAFVLWLAHEVR